MFVILCVDNNNGTMFNHRRQSQDRILRQHILDRVGDKLLHVTPYTAKQFTQEQQMRLAASEDCLITAGEGEYCFAEGEALVPFSTRIEGILLYRWNRLYPTDTTLDIQVPGPGWELVSTEEFQGSSHPKITEEVYKKTKV